MYLFQTPNSQFQIRIIAPGIFRVMMSDGGSSWNPCFPDITF